MEIALVTGASSGIGRELVKRLLTSGYEVVGLSRSREKLEKLQGEVNSSHFTVYPCDVSDLGSVKQVSLQMKEKGKIPKILFLNAGVAGDSALESVDVLDLKKHQEIYSVNYFGVLHFVHEWLKPCSENGGATFVVTGSVNAKFAPPGGSAYASSKAAIAKAFDGLRLTHANSPLKFLTVFCGPVDTPGLSGSIPFTWKPEKMAKYMIRCAKKGRSRSNPSKFYAMVCCLLDALPEKMVKKLLK